MAQLATDNQPADQEEAVETPEVSPTVVRDGEFLLDQLLWRFWQWAEQCYRDGRGPTAHFENLRQSIKRLTRQFGRMPVASFGRAQVRAFRERLIEGGASRTYINKLVGHVKQVFAWGMEEEIVPELVAFRVIKTKNLKAGRRAARETAPVEPVADYWVEATLPYVTPPVRAMVQLQRVTGMRSSNVCDMRRSEIDMRDRKWVYTPQRHKTQHLGHRFRKTLGPRARAILRPLIEGLGTELDTYVFSPASAARRREVGGKFLAT